MAKLIIVGIGYKPLDARAGTPCLQPSLFLVRGACARCSKDTRTRVVGHKVKRIDSVDGTMKFIRETLPRALRHGSPGLRRPPLYGIGARALRELGREAVEIILT